MIRSRALLALPLLLTPALLLAPAIASAQSFNCSNATTAVEKLICATDALKELDTSLDQKVNVALNASLAERAQLLAEERAWVADRDKKCAIPAGARDKEQSAKGAACLEAAYRDRIAAIDALIKQQEAARLPDRALCQRMVDEYKNVIAADPKAFVDKDADKPGMAASPLTVLEGARHTIFHRARPLAELADASPAQVERWAKKQKPAIKIPKKVMDEIFLDEPTILAIERAPGTNFYATSTEQGTAHCIIANYFEVKDGVAVSAGSPPWGEDSCGVDQFFGTIDGKTVAIESNNALYQPMIDAQLSIMAWDNGFFRASCTADFQYEPAFAAMEPDKDQPADEKCDSEQCKALAPQARALVEVAQHNPLDARKAALDRLTPAQRKIFDEMEKLAPRPSYSEPLKPEEAANPASYREDDALLVPLVKDNDVYLARVGHTTMGWRTFSDWSVRIERLDKAELKGVGTVYVQMIPGRLRSATVR